MGCSPSHSGIVQILARNTANPLKKNKAILPPGQDNNRTTHPLASNRNPSLSEDPKQKNRSQGSDHEINHTDKEFSDVRGGMSRKGSVSDDQQKDERHGTANEGTVDVTGQKKRKVRKYSSTGSEQEQQQDVQQDGKPRRGRKSKGRKSVKHTRRAKRCQIDINEEKVDFPELLVKAHQDAYAFLNPNLSKFEAIISMANQTTQTQIIMQQMMTFMALRFDEINQCLGEIAEDGEKLLKEVGSNLTWPCRKDDVSEHPDLLQQLLQYTVNRMQSLNCTVSSLTTNALQEACHFLQSALNSFQEKLAKKAHHDKCLQKMIKEFEDLATGFTQSQPNDSTLYSEDSGIGVDSESIRGYRSPSKIERQMSIDTLRHVSLTKSEESTKNNPTDPSAVLKNEPDKTDDKPSQTQFNNPRVSKQISFTSSHSLSSLGTTATLAEDSVQDQDAEDTTSSDESSEESDDNKSISSQVTLPQRPLTSPAGTCAYKPAPKWIENPENEEMTLKMKEAISEKIKFVPEKSNTDMWTREEVDPGVLRPSTADGSNRRTARHRRCRSAESLKSQAEDPTLLELQRTQKELSKKLEQLYPTNGPRNKEAPQNSINKSYVHTGCISSRAAPNNKLKACLDKNFNILPSQERITLRKLNNDCITNPDCKTVGPTLPKQDVKTEESFTIAKSRIESIISPRQSVRKLIQAFSPEDDLVKTSKVKTLGPLRCVRKFGIPVLPPTIPAYRGLAPLDTKCDHSSAADENSSNITVDLTASRSHPLPPSASQDPTKSDTIESEFEDLENFPPPPPEILLDDSFNLLQSNSLDKDNTLSCPAKNPSTSSKIKSSIIIKDLLPSKNTSETYMPTLKTSSVKEPVTGLRKYSLQSSQQNRNKDLGLDTQKKQEIEEVAHLYKQSHKIIPLQNPSDSESVKLIPHIESGEKSSPMSLRKQKQCSPSPPLQRCEKSPVTLRRTSPTRATASSPPADRKLASPPTNRARTRSQVQPSPPQLQSPPTNRARTRSQVQPSPPQLQSPPTNRARTHSSVGPSPPPLQKSISPTCSSRVPSPPDQCKLSSPPALRKLPSPHQIQRQESPPNQRRLPSPPQIQRQESPPSQRRLPSPPQIRRQESPPSQRRLPSPPQTRTQESPPSQRKLPSPPQIRRQESPPSQRKLPSSPQIRRQESPPSQRKLQSPPQTRKLQSPPNQRRVPSVPSPPSSRREPSPPSHFTPSPPLSPSFTPRRLRSNSDDSQTSTKMIGNAQSIFCPSSTSIFETKPASPPLSAGSETASKQASVSVLKHSLSSRQYGDQHRRTAMSAANPQPFVRRSYSDRRPRVQLRLPTSASTSACQQTGPDESMRRDGQSGSSLSLEDLKSSSQRSCDSPLCVVGQGLQ